ncbi:MAG: RHS repeat-associated core domain-containing protein, partial [Solirubrobacteraceae bacterium]
TGDEDTYAYNDAGEMSEVKMAKGSETLASVAYIRDKDGLVTKITDKGLPGEEALNYEYDANNRLTEDAGKAYKYDKANNPTVEGAAEYKYDEGDAIEKGGTTNYSYNELGERTKRTPEKGPATTYVYDQAGNLTGVERPEGEGKPKIEDTYAYNGDGLRASQTINSTTSYLAWDTAESLPLILNDGTNSYIYGPGGLPVEQINSEGTLTYLHHDQQGSTRLLTNAVGENVGSATYDAYGNIVGKAGTVTTPLGYDAQYTDNDTGLIYLRAREYDPATGQFLSVDPKAEVTRTIYGYAQDNPLVDNDPTGEYAETNINEVRFARKFLHGIARVNAQLAFEHGERVPIFEELAEYAFYQGLYDVSTDTGLQRSYQIQFEKYKNLAEKHIFSAVAPLEELETADSAEDIVKTLVSIARKWFG